MRLPLFGQPTDEPYATRDTRLVRELVLAWAQRFMRSVRVFLGVLRTAAIEVPCGTDAAIQIFDDDVVAFTRLTDLLLLVSTTFPYLCDCRLGDGEACHADGNCHTNEYNCDTAQGLLPDFHGLSG
jgi:hypothetical protein